MIHIVIKVRDMENLDKDHMLIDNSHHRMAMYIDKYNNSKLAVYMYHHLNIHLNCKLNPNLCNQTVVTTKYTSYVDYLHIEQS